jgi:folate-binding protein YgfZ
VIDDDSILQNEVEGFRHRGLLRRPSNIRKPALAPAEEGLTSARMVNAAILPSRAALRVSGPDARAYLQGLITQEPPPAGQAAFAALLSPQGKILFDFLIYCGGESFLFDCDRACSEALAKRLSLYRLRANVTIEPLNDWAIGVDWGRDRSAVGGAAIFFDPRLLALGQRIIGPRNIIAERLPPANDNAWRKVRIEAGVPEFGSDFASEEVFLLDVNYDALSGVSYAKGCFVGQEVTSRMKRKGEIRKRTLLLSFDGPPPAKGAPVTAGETTLGAVMSGVDGAALALLRVDRLAEAQVAGAQL